MSRESSLSQIESERIAIEQQVLEERGPDENLAAPNPGIIVVPLETPSIFPLGLSGSLTKLSTGEDYLICGSNISLTTASNGSVIIDSNSLTVAGSDTQVQYNAGGQLAASSYFTYNNITQTVSVPNISGSLTKLSTGADFIKAGSGIVISTGSNGSITISATLPGNSTWQSYDPIIGATTTAPTLPTTHNLHGRYFIQGKVMTLMFNLSGNSSLGASAGLGDYTISLPPGFAIDTSVVGLGTAPNYDESPPVAIATLIVDSAGSGGAWSVVANSSTTLVLVGQDPSSSSQPLVWGSNYFSIGSSNDYRISFVATLPLV